MVEFRMRRVEATMYIIGFTDILPRKAPAAAIIMLRAISFFAPNLSEKKPVGIEKKVWQRVGIAKRSPICWLVRRNSFMRTGKMVDRILPAA